MPDPRPLSPELEALRRRLDAAMAPEQVFGATPWGDPQAFTQVLRKVERSFDGMASAPPLASIQDVVTAFRQGRPPAGFNQLKYLCYGLTLAPRNGGLRLIDEPGQIDRVLGDVDRQRSEPRRFRRCYQALLQSYFSFERIESPGPATERNFRSLRAYLSAGLSIVATSVGGRAAPGWVLMLVEHRSLLGDDPCAPYVADLHHGESSQFASVCAELGVSRQSWLWQEVIHAYLRDICRRTDPAFKLALPEALKLAAGLTDLQPSAATRRDVLAELLRRYRRASERPEHPRLRDLAVEHIGNPWLRRTAWDAWVQDEAARQMVDGWLKRRLIHDFFELLSDSGRSDTRRLDYWLRFADAIEQMWFVLGSDALNNRSAEFRQLRARMAGQDRILVGSTTRENNAFVMRIGSWYLIEFGVTGNACFAIPVDKFTGNLDQRQLDIYVLKPRSNAERYSHASSWESKFDQAICPKIGFWPDGKPRHYSEPAISVPQGSARPLRSAHESTAAHKYADEGLWALLEWCRASSIPVEDLRPKGGSLWVRADPVANADVVLQLIRQGFKYKPGRGYWLAAEE
ncbi:EH signature domain-containing protein [Derxia lacustris]|uniref:EH signature domain-containing protein n=1 Tax=Derxia lacustris TaxID=764842 RepID=UPI000A16E039|nr:EH signature domain-containing protein [Derxia lacustris]